MEQSIQMVEIDDIPAEALGPADRFKHSRPSVIPEEDGEEPNKEETSLFYGRRESNTSRNFQVKRLIKNVTP